MNIFEIGMIIFIPLGTFLLNAWRKMLSNTKSGHQITYTLFAIVMGVSPLIYVRSIEPNHTVLGVILASISAFWFAIVGSRRMNT
jgi:hypothetical protein